MAVVTGWMMLSFLYPDETGFRDLEKLKQKTLPDGGFEGGNHALN